MLTAATRPSAREATPVLRWLLLTVLVLTAVPLGVGAPGTAAAAPAADLPPGPPSITTAWLASVSQTQAVAYFETDQPAQGFVDYGLTPSLGRVRSSPEGTEHTITMTNLNPNTLYYWRVRAENANGQDTSETFAFRTPPSSATARLIVTKKNSDQTLTLPGACFDLFMDAGSGRLGTYIAGYCDRYDGVGEDGVTTFPALNGGIYVLVESRSPDGYALARNTIVNLIPGQTLNLTVTNPTGGTRVVVTKRDNESGAVVPGACFQVYKNVNGSFGAYVGFGCDDYDGNDGVTTLGNLRTGSYFLYQSDVPGGYVAGPIIPFSVDYTMDVYNIDYGKYAETAGDNVELWARDSSDNLLPGACFALFAGGAFVAEACDGWDGRFDGRTFFTDVAPGSYLVIQHRAPDGHQVGKRTTFTKVDDQLLRRRFTQVPGGQKVVVKTLKGNSDVAVLRGVCYRLFRQVSGPDPLVAFWCDADDGSSDGVTRFAGIPSGTYTLQQFNTPSGYARPADRTITVGTTTRNVRVRTYTTAMAAQAAEAPKATAAPSPTPSPEPTVAVEPTAVPTETATPEPTPTEVPNASPVANAGADQALTDADASGDEAVALDGSASTDPEGGALTFSWSIGGTEIATGATATATLPVGTHTILLTATDAAGASATDEVTVVVEDPPAPEPAAQPAGGEGGNPAAEQG